MVQFIGHRPGRQATVTISGCSLVCCVDFAKSSHPARSTTATIVKINSNIPTDASSLQTQMCAILACPAVRLPGTQLQPKKLGLLTCDNEAEGTHWRCGAFQ